MNERTKNIITKIVIGLAIYCAANIIVGVVAIVGHIIGGIGIPATVCIAIAIFVIVRKKKKLE